MFKNNKLKLVIPTTILLSACSATPEQCDPSLELSVFQKMACVNSGSYDDRISQREQTLSNEQARSQELQSKNETAKAQNQHSQQQVNTKKTELNKLNQGLQKETDELKRKAANNQQVRDEINSIEQQMNQVNSSGASDVVKQQELKKLQEKLATYQKALGQ